MAVNPWINIIYYIYDFKEFLSEGSKLFQLKSEKVGRAARTVNNFSLQANTGEVSLSLE